MYYRTEHFSRGKKGPKGAENQKVPRKGEEEGWPAKGAKRKKRTRENRSVKVGIIWVFVNVPKFSGLQKGPEKKVPRKNCRKVSKNFLALFDDFCPARKLSKSVEKLFDTF